ncbi:hypothetical protein CDD82_3579 [Ophiocordyceps australis]|uniref:SMP-30/Gluconolactonase/LRE-like region domain-containing protein n=1 Tax=Ophiocordyceps australis TaxID=1399860 RepID=A0A2C5ZCY4_9HYPO|nr:hypothetical protein CDD82_3579 [Ophiocordyceps australis]
MLTPLVLSLLSASASAQAISKCSAPGKGPVGQPPVGQAGSGEAPGASACQPQPGNVTLDKFQLYPENAGIDTERCLVYFSVLYNSSVAVWNPLENKFLDDIIIQNISGQASQHASGVRRDAAHDTLSIMLNAGAAFDTSGSDISGANFLVSYNLTSQSTKYITDLTRFTDGKYGGFQDFEHGDDGSTYVIGTYPGSLYKVSPDGNDVKALWLSKKENGSFLNITGVGKADDKTLVTPGTGDSNGLYRFDITSESCEPVQIPLTAANGNGTLGPDLDGALFPATYNRDILLVSENTEGTYVIRSNDQWKSAEILGLIPNPFAADGGSSVATVQVGSTIYLVTEFFVDAANPPVPGTLAGNRTEFPLRDITEQVAKLAGKATVQV